MKANFTSAIYILRDLGYKVRIVSSTYDGFPSDEKTYTPVFESWEKSIRVKSLDKRKYFLVEGSFDTQICVVEYQFGEYQSKFFSGTNYDLADPEDFLKFKMIFENA